MKKTTKKTQVTYGHLSQNERDRIEILIGQGYSIRKIAEVLGRDHSTLSRELKKYSRVICRGKKNGKGRIVGEYDANVASHKAYVKRKYAKFEWKKINEDSSILEYVTTRLEMGWSPSDIASRSKNELTKHISKTAIYEWLRADSRGQKYCQYLYSGRKKVKQHRKNKTIREIIPGRVGIEMRPKYIDKREKCGHCEADLIVSGRKKLGSSKEALSVIVDRKGKYIHLRKIRRATAQLFNSSVKEASDKLTRIDSLTLDNGKENSKWQDMNISQVYFCSPYHPWEKGSVENINLWLRRYFKKGSDLANYSEEYVKYVETIMVQ